jgi:hypothetical protein
MENRVMGRRCSILQTHSPCDDLDGYIRLHDDCLSRRLPPPWPETVEQLRWLAERDPERAAICLPRDAGEIEALGLSPYTGKPVPTFGQRFRERLLATLLDDPEFAAAIRQTIGGA